MSVKSESISYAYPWPPLLAAPASHGPLLHSTDHTCAVLTICIPHRSHLCSADHTCSVPTMLVPQGPFLWPADHAYAMLTTPAYLDHSCTVHHVALQVWFGFTLWWTWTRPKVWFCWGQVQGSQKVENRTQSPVWGSEKYTPEPDLTRPRQPYQYQIKQCPKFNIS